MTKHQPKGRPQGSPFLEPHELITRLTTAEVGAGELLEQFLESRSPSALNALVTLLAALAGEPDVDRVVVDPWGRVSLARITHIADAGVLSSAAGRSA